MSEKKNAMLNEALRNFLIALKNRDGELRTTILKEGSLNDGYDSRMEALHIENAEKLHEIIEKHGWPGRSLVGKDGADAACTLANHSISTAELQRSFLYHIQEAVKGGEATLRQVACLEDRIRFNEGKPLRYGMLFEWNEAGDLIANVENVELANKLRREMGLPTIEEAKDRHRKEIAIEGGGPPSDYQEHKRQELAWATRVGWR